MFASLRLHHTLRKPELAQRHLLHRLVHTVPGTQFSVDDTRDQDDDVARYRSQIGFMANAHTRPQTELRQFPTIQSMTSQKASVFIQEVSFGRTVKTIPRTNADISNMAQDVRVAACSLLKRYGLFRGRILAIVSNAGENHTSSGDSIETPFSLWFQFLPKFIQRRNVLPRGVMQIRDEQLRYLAIAIFTLAESSVSSIVTANPATLLNLLSAIEEKFTDICLAIETGDLPTEIARQVESRSRFQASPKRAKQLRDLKKSQDKVGFGELLPNLRGLVCWKMDSTRVSIRHVRRYLPQNLPVIDLGFNIAEMLGTVNVNTSSDSCVPLPGRVFYEFVARHSWESGYGAVKSLHELSVGQEYYVFVTTRSGLYRYALSQIIRVTGKVDNTPSWSIVQSDDRELSLLGERLKQSEVADAIEALNEAHRCDIDEFLLVANPNELQYTLYFESESDLLDDLVATWFDQALARSNSQWIVRRSGENLSKPIAQRLAPGSINRHRATLAPTSEMEPETEFPRLQYLAECTLELPRLQN